MGIFINYDTSKDTGCHELLHAASWESGILWSDKVKVEPVSQLNVRAKLHWIILVLPWNVEKEPTVVGRGIHVCM